MREILQLGVFLGELSGEGGYSQGEFLYSEGEVTNLSFLLSLSGLDDSPDLLKSALEMAFFLIQIPLQLFNSIFLFSEFFLIPPHGLLPLLHNPHKLPLDRLHLKPIMLHGLSILLIFPTHSLQLL